MNTDSHSSHGAEWRLSLRFHLFRKNDVSRVSGTGIVAEGTLWSSGAVALHWPGHPRSTSVWSSVDDLLDAHGHSGATELRWLDDDASGTVDGTTGGVDKDSAGWPILRSSHDIECDGKNPATGRSCILGHHKGFHRDESGTEWLDDGSESQTRPDWMHGHPFELRD